MNIGATFLGGAQGRLLPASLPFRFFATGIVFHILTWIALFASAADVPDFAGGLGPPLAALHLLTLGVFGNVAIGAALQMLPVATRQAIPSTRPIRLAYWLYLPGVFMLVHGMETYSLLLAETGAVLAGTALLIIAVLLADNLRRAKDLPLVAAYGWLSAAALVALVSLGLLLTFDFNFGLLSDHRTVALSHLILAVFGFMGMLAVGLSHILVPMFALSPGVPAKIGRPGFAAWLAAIVLALAGAVAGSRAIFALAVICALAGSGFYLWGMAQLWNRRLRKNLGLSFVLVRISWVLLPLSLLVALAAALGTTGPRTVTLAAFLALWGWLLTFLTGILQRIMPFLASMHASKIKGKPPLLSELTSETPLRIHAFCHLAALALVAAGIVADLPLLVRAGAVAGLVGAIAFALFAIPIVRRLFFTKTQAPEAAA